MSDARVEIAPDGSAPTDRAAQLFEWPLAAHPTTTMKSEIDWAMTQFPGADPAARDLLRVAGGAYVADRAARQPSVSLRRELLVTVHVEQPDMWTEPVRERAADLLHWLTGDDWGLRCAQADDQTPSTADTLDVAAADDICLLSGGLDSLCGALIRIRAPGTVLFIGHADASTAIRRAQQRLEAHLAAQAPPRAYGQFALRPLGDCPNRTPKTRSLLFMAMAVVAASSLGAQRVLVPENGFTSINPPLEPSRAGVMTTRSTHPWTFHAVAALLDSLGLGHIAVHNPHAALTKGELLAQAMPRATPADQALAAATVSCAKLNAGRPKKGSPNLQCGLCVACLVRRAAFLRAKVPDLTPYASLSSMAALAASTQRARRHDVAAWRAATEDGIPEHRILGSALWPPGTDFDALLDVCARGLKELRRVPA